MFENNWTYGKIRETGTSLIDEILRLRAGKDPGFSLERDMKSLHDPFLLNDMDKAVSKITEAIEKQVRICIYGDYDADGLTSAAILVKFLSEIGADCGYFIPDRFDDGYGLNKESISELVKEGYKLVITTDCGINSVEEADIIRKFGVDLIITDHHQSTGELPDAHAVICCTRYDSSYPFEYLSGAGIAFKLVSALKMHLGLELNTDGLLAMAALGTVADIVPLTGENRILVHNGIDMIKRGKCLSLSALIEYSGREPEECDAYTLGFIAGPRINAAGRMGSAGSAMDLLLADDIGSALKNAELLDKLNSDRKAVQETNYRIVKESIENDRDILNAPVIVCAAERLHKGVVGIVASKITEDYGKPAVILGLDGYAAEGSGRGNGSFSLVEALKHCDPLLSRYGGHKMAAGLELKAADVGPFRQMICEFAVNNTSKDADSYEKEYDILVGPDSVTLAQAANMESLSPFGAGNRKPVLVMNEATLMSHRVVGNDKAHLQMTYGKNGHVIKSIFFNGARYGMLLYDDSKYDIAFNLEVNEFRNTRLPQMVIRNIKMPESRPDASPLLIVRVLLDMIEYGKNVAVETLMDKLPARLYELSMPHLAESVETGCLDTGVTRGEMADVYMQLKKLTADSTFDAALMDIGIEPWKAVICVEVMRELGIINAAPVGLSGYIYFGRTAKRSDDLGESIIYRALNRIG